MAARPMIRLRPRGLVTQMFVLVVLPSMVFLVATAYGGVALHNHAMQSLVAERDERAVRAAAAALSENFKSRRLLLQLIAEQMANGTDLAAILAAMPSLRETFNYGLVAYNRDGIPVQTYQPIFAWQPSIGGLTVIPGWQRHPENGEAYILTAVTSQNSALTLYAALSITALSGTETLPIIESSPETTLYLIADNNQVLYDSSLAGGGLPVTAVPHDHTTHAEQPQSDPDSAAEIITVQARIDGLNWLLVVREPWDAVNTPTLRLSLIAPLAAVPAILIAVAALGFGLFGVVLPIGRLRQAANRLEWGEYKAIAPSVGGIQEVRDLHETLRGMASRLQSAQAAMRSYIGAVLQGQEDERRRIARELHDDTLQSLIALDQRRGMAARTLERDPAKAGEHLANLHTMIEENITSLRRLIRNMRPTYLEDLGLVTALEALCTQQAEKSGVLIAFQTEGAARRLTHNQEMALYRIAQEALQNAIRHAEATRLTVKLAFSAAVELSIVDNGRGFTLPERPNELARAGHYGLVGMAERAEQAGGTLGIDSGPGKGTAIRVQVA